jgi:pimeloyl-ACP methyl ester carboxylesterase
MSEPTLNQFRDTYSPRTVQTSAGPFDIWGGRGDGQPMVFLPGAQGTGEVFYKPVLGFGDRFNTATLTYPAVSDADVLAKGLAELMQAEGLTDVILVGSSFGGYVAQRFAQAHTGLLAGLVIGNSFADASSVQATRYNPDTLGEMDPEALKETMLGRLRDGPESELRTVLLDVMGENQPAAFLKSRAMGVATSTAVTAPPLPLSKILVIDSDPDPVIGEEMRDGLSALYAGAAHTRISGGTHYPYIVTYGPYSAAISDFVETF